MNPAIGFAVLSMLLWGVWVVFVKVATRSLRPETTMVISYVTGLALVVPYLFLTADTVSLDRRGVAFAVAAGVFGSGGVVALYAGLDHGSASIVTTISALYFVVAGVLGVLVFGESLGLRGLAGIAFAVAAIVLLAT